MRIAIRTDASAEIGTGHLMRCLCLAKCLAERGHQILFICNPLPLSLKQQLAAYSLPLCELAEAKLPIQQHAPQTWLGRSQDQDAQLTIQALAHHSSESWDWLIVDHYAIDQRWQSLLQKQVKDILVIDDLANRQHHCSMLIDQGLKRKLSDYQPLLAPPSSTLLGLDYCLLREEFQHAKQQLRRKPPNQKLKLLINMGGADLGNMSLKILHLLEQSRFAASLSLTIITGAAYPYQEQLQQQLLHSPIPSQYFHDVSNMAQHLLAADIAIGACGGAAWERVALQLPSLCLVLAENQQANARALQDIKVAQALEELELSTPHALDKAISQLLTDYASITASCEKLIDLNGSSRIAVAMESQQINQQRHAYLKLASPSDSETLLRWQQHPNTRKFALNPATPVPDEHHAWFKQALSNPAEHIFIIRVNNQDVGCVRTSQMARFGHYLVSIYIAPEHYQQGFASMALTQIRQLLPQAFFHATILPVNIPSKKLFQSQAYIQVNQQSWLQPPRPIHD
ncbi:UDP-2,4-diacetamido-2,4,6-trideoxy-beta-L-altropyranose hydrolase [Agarivorans gilvus]|nr:UDP-2,4-diacetamido-2,4,6-trideoxy-beta-L-altropyranose hydrolase [Agarivorans gilvus]